MTKNIMKDLISISDHHRHIKEELNFVYETMIIGLIDDAKKLDNCIGKFLDFPIKGVFYNDSCVLPTGGEHVYYKPLTTGFKTSTVIKGVLERVVIECPQAFIDSPEELYGQDGVVNKITQVIVADKKSKRRNRFSAQPNSAYVSLCFIMGYINEIMSRINGEDTVYYLDKHECDTLKVDTYIIPANFVKDGYTTDHILAMHPDALNIVKNIESSITRFMEFHDWKYIRIARAAPSMFRDVMPILRIQACGDLRIIRYHNDAIKAIMNMKSRIESGLVSDIRVAEAYRNL